MSVRSIIIRFLWLVVLGGVLVANLPASAQSARTVVDTVGLEKGDDVELHARRGHIDVRTWDRAAIRVRAEIVGDDPEQVEETTIEVSRDTGGVAVKPDGEDVESPGFFEVVGAAFFGHEEPKGPETNYTVRLPSWASLRLSMNAASAEITGLQSEVEIEGISSSVTVRDVEGRVVAGTLSGRLHAENIEGELLLGTFSGNLEAKVSTLADDLQMGSFSGDAEITLPADAAFDLQTDVSWGGVTSDFSLPDSVSATEAPEVPIGGGGPMVVFESFTGSLTLRAE